MSGESKKDDHVVTIPELLGVEKEPENEKSEDEPKRVAQEEEKIAEKPPEKHPEKWPETAFNQQDVKNWFERVGWSGCPFTFTIDPSLFVGYSEQLDKTLVLLEEGHKLILVVGPTGSGKTSMLKRVAESVADKAEYIYIGKPPGKPDEFVEIFGDKFKRPWYARIFRPFFSHIRNLFQLPDMLNKRLKNKRLIVMFDEAHEANIEVLEWLRVLTDQVNNMSVIVSGLPVFDEKLNELETFRKRIVTKIELLSLTKEETQEMVRKRIEKVGGTRLEPFDAGVIDTIFERTGGFPREVLKVCDDLVNRAASLGKGTITQDLLMLDIREKPKAISLDLIEKMTPMQKDIIGALGKKASTPGDIANTINLKKYKSRQHAVRSINNILKGLMKDGFVERKRSDKAFVYQLSPRIKTLVVKA